MLISFGCMFIHWIIPTYGSLLLLLEKIQDTQTSENSSTICQNYFQYLLSLKQLRRDASESCQKMVPMPLNSC